jgi:hypothetical protein
VLLRSSRGDPLAYSVPVQSGRVIAISSAGPLTNDGLRDASTARWVLREIVSPTAANASVAFDEAHHSLPISATAESEEQTLDELLLTTAPGRALLLGMAFVFVYILLTGARLGPALRPREAAESNRTMFEHVQAMAALYRRSRQLGYLREHFLRHYRRVVGRAMGVDALDDGVVEGVAERSYEPGTRAALREVGTSLEAVASAGSDRQLIEAVGRIELALETLPRAARGTLSSQ